MTGFVEQATLSIDDKASSKVRSLNKDINNLIRNAKRLNGLKFDFGGIKQAQSQVRSLAKSINALPKSKTVTLTTRNVTQNVTRGAAGGVVPPVAMGGMGSPNGRGRGNLFFGGQNDSNLQSAGRIIARAFTATIGFDLRRVVDSAGRSAGSGVVTLDTARANANVAGIRDVQGFEASARSAALSTSGVSAGDIMSAMIEQVATLQAQLDAGSISVEQYTKRLDNLTKTTAETTQAFGTIRGSFARGAEDTRQLYRTLPLTNAGNDLAKQGGFITSMVNAIAASGGDLTGDEIRRMMQQLGPVVAQSLSDVGLARLALIRDEGGRQSTAEARQAFGDLTRGNLSKADTAAQIEQGLRDPSGRTKFGKTDFADPVGFWEINIVPKLEKLGVNLNDIVAVTDALDKQLGFTTSGARFGASAVVQVGQNKTELARFRNTDANRALEAPTLVTAFKEIETSFQDAISANSDSIVGALKFGAQGISGLFDKLGKGQLPSVEDAAGFAAVGIASALQATLDPTTRPLALAALALDGAAAALTASAGALTVAAGAGATGGIGAFLLSGLRRIGGGLGLATMLTGSSADNAYTSMSADDRQKARNQTVIDASLQNIRMQLEGVPNELKSVLPAMGQDRTDALDSFLAGPQVTAFTDRFQSTFDTGAQKLTDSGATAGTNFSTAAFGDAASAGAAFGAAARAEINAAAVNINVQQSPARAAATPPNLGAVTPTE
ncbi:hypothetical protein [Rhizobium leguminosarum]|uniref:hypothetical protein n=1 Tax=Rhizobium leguminosarum TaxID=384 RepID=UPI00140F5054|nr:hypothetical protein [Rhizobium leguminosarum]QIO64715.1 hypothetical protein HA462_06515 [Rhizobium leguminosarum bv. trifolii]